MPHITCSTRPIIPFLPTHLVLPTKLAIATPTKCDKFPQRLTSPILVVACQPKPRPAPLLRLTLAPLLSGWCLQLGMADTARASETANADPTMLAAYIPIAGVSLTILGLLFTIVRAFGEFNLKAGEVLAKLDHLDAKITDTEKRLKDEITDTEKRLKDEITDTKNRLKDEMAALEKLVFQQFALNREITSLQIENIKISLSQTNASKPQTKTQDSAQDSATVKP